MLEMPNCFLLFPKVQFTEERSNVFLSISQSTWDQPLSYNIIHINRNQRESKKKLKTVKKDIPQQVKLFNSRKAYCENNFLNYKKRKDTIYISWILVYISGYISQQSLPTYFDPIKQHHEEHPSLIQPVSKWTDVYVYVSLWLPFSSNNDFACHLKYKFKQFIWV